jgi:AsmA family
MKRFFKYSLLAISLTTILIAGLVIFIIFFLDLNSYQPLISQAVKKEMQRELAFEGDISFAAFPKIRLNLRQFSLSEYKTRKKFITADSIHLTLPLRQLFDKQLTLDEISIKGLKAALIRYPDGRTNIDNLLTADDKKKEFVLGQARIEITRFIFHDARNKKQFTLSGLTLESVKITNKNLNNLALKTKGSMKNLRNHASYDFAIKLNVPDMLFNHDHISSNHIRLITKGAHSQQKISAELTLTNLIASAHYFHSDAMVIKMLAKNDTQIIKTHLSSPMNGELDSQELHLPDLKAGIAVTANHSFSQSIHGNLLGSMSMSNSSEQIDVNLTGNVENSAIQAIFNIAGFDEPVVNFDVTIDHLNTDQFQFNYNQAESNNLRNNKPPDKAVDFSLWPDLDVNGSIYIGTAQIADTALSGVTFKIQSDGKNLNYTADLINRAY